MGNYVLKRLVLYQAMYVWTYCSERFVEIWEVRFTLRCQVLEQKDWKLSLEIKSNEYISVFPLIFQFPLNVLCSYKALIHSTCNSGLYRTCKHSKFFFSAYHLSLIFCQLSEYLYFYKMKTCKISCRQVKISISPRVGNFQFSARGERYVYLKKNSPGGEFHLAYV